jgi:hypothetical protein
LGEWLYSSTHVPVQISVGFPAILIQVLNDFPQAPQANAGYYLQVGHDQSLLTHHSRSSYITFAFETTSVIVRTLQ